jgi:hypothetical protein
MTQGTAPDPSKYAVGDWTPSGYGYGTGYGGQGGGTTAAPPTTTTTTPATTTPAPSRFTPTLPARTQNTSRGPAYPGMPTSLMPASMRPSVGKSGKTKVGGWKRSRKKQTI